jgi:hypothetical protein
MWPKPNIIATNKQKIQWTVLTGNAQNKSELKMKFPRAADDTCTSFGATANPTVSNQSATLKLPAKKVWIQITHTRQNTRHKKRETVKQKKGRYLPAEKLLGPREMEIPDTTARRSCCRWGRCWLRWRWKKEGQKIRELNGSAGTRPTKGPRNKRSA